MSTPRRGRRRSLRVQDESENEGNVEGIFSDKDKIMSVKSRGRMKNTERQTIVEIKEEEDNDADELNPTKSPRRGRERSPKKSNTNIGGTVHSPSREKGMSQSSEDENEDYDKDCDNKKSNKAKNSPSRHRGRGARRGRGRGRKQQDNEDDGVNDMKDSEIGMISTTHSPSRSKGLHQKSLKKIIDDDGDDEDDDDDNGDDFDSGQEKNSPDGQRGKIKGSSDGFEKPNSKDEEAEEPEDNERSSLGESLDICPDEFMVEEAESDEVEAQNISTEDFTAEDKMNSGEKEYPNKSIEDFTVEEEKEFQNVCFGLVEEGISDKNPNQNVCAEDLKEEGNATVRKNEDQDMVQNNQENEEQTDFINFGVEETDLYESEEENVEDTEEDAEEENVEDTEEDPYDKTVPLEEDKEKEKTVQDMEVDQIKEDKTKDEIKKDVKVGSILSRLGPPVKRNNNLEDSSDKSDNDSDDGERKTKRSKMMSERYDLTSSSVKDDDPDSDGEQENPFKIPGMCFKFNTCGRCINRYCKWPHRCDECGGDHPKFRCIKFKKRREKEEKKGLTVFFDQEEEKSSNETVVDGNTNDDNAKQKITKMFVKSKSKNMSNVTAEDMRDAFIQFGAIKSVTIPKHCAYAFIDFKDPDSVDKAIKFGTENPISVKNHILNPGEHSKKLGDSEKRKATEDLREKIKVAKTDNQQVISRTKRKKLYCNVCQIPLGFMSIEDHAESSKHDDNILRVFNLLGMDKKAKFDVDSAMKTSIELNIVNKDENRDFEYACMVCSSEFKDKNILGEHLRKDSHRKRTAENLRNIDISNLPIYIKDLSSGQSLESSQSSSDIKPSNVNEKENQRTLPKSENDLEKNSTEEMPEESKDLKELTCDKIETIKLSIPKDKCSSINGEGNAKLLLICIQSKAEITFDKSTKSAKHGFYNIKGTKKQIEMARQLIFDKVGVISSQSMQEFDGDEGKQENQGANKTEESSDIIKTVYFSLPANKCGQVIGKGRCELTNISQISGAMITIDKSTKKNREQRTFIIKGSEKQIKEAKDMMNKKADEVQSQSIQETSGELEVKPLMPETEKRKEIYDIIRSEPFRLPADKCGQVIGKGRCELMNISEKTGAIISIDNASKKDHQYRMFIIKGTKEQIKEAKAMMTERAEAVQSQSIQETSGELEVKPLMLETEKPKEIFDIIRIEPFRLPANKCGQVIGKGRCELMSISEKTGAIISIDNSSKKDHQYRTFIIKGTKEEIKEAKTMMTERAEAYLPLDKKVNDEKKSNMKNSDTVPRHGLTGTLVPINVKPISGFPLQQTKLGQRMNPNSVLLSGVPLQPMQPILAQATPPMLSHSGLLGPAPKVVKQKASSNVSGYSHKAANITDYSYVSNPTDYSQRAKEKEINMEDGILGSAPSHSVPSFHDTSTDLTPVPMTEDSDDDLTCDINIAKSKLFIGNLPKGLSEEIMKKLLNICGEVRDLECELVDGYIESCCTVTFKKVVSVYHAHKHLNGMAVMDKKIMTTILLKDVQKENESQSSYHKSDQSIVKMIIDNYVSDMKSSSSNRSRSPEKYVNARETTSNSRNNQRSRSPLREPKYGTEREIHHSKSLKNFNIPKQSVSYEENLYPTKMTGREFVILNLNQEIGENLLIPMLKDCSQITNYINKEGQFVLKFGDGEVAVLLAKVLNETRFPDRNLLIDNSDLILQTNVSDLKLNVMEQFVSDGLKKNQHRFINYWQSLYVTSEDLWMDYLMMDNWRDTCVAGLGKTYHILIESIIKLNKFQINAQGAVSDGIYVLVVTPTAFVAQCLTAAVQRVALENKQFVETITEEKFSTGGGSVIVGTALGIREMMRNTNRHLSETLKVLILDDATRLMKEQITVLRNITNNLTVNSMKSHAKIRLNKIAVVEKANQQELNSLSTLLKCLLFTEGDSSLLPHSHMGNQSGFSRGSQSQISRLDANQPSTSFQSSRGRHQSKLKQGESSTQRFDSKEDARNSRNAYSSSIQKGVSYSNQESDDNSFYGLDVKQIAQATLGQDSVATKELIRTYLKAKGITPVQEIIFHIASAVSSEQKNLSDSPLSSKRQKTNDWELALEEVGDEIIDDSKVNTMSGFKQRDQDLAPQYESSGRKSGILKKPGNRLQHGSNRKSGSLPLQDISDKSFDSRSKEQDKLLLMSGTISDNSERPYESRDRGTESLQQRSTQQSGLLPMPDMADRSFEYGARKDNSLGQRRSPQQSRLLPMSDTSDRLYGSLGRSTEQSGLLPIPDTLGTPYDSRDRDDHLMQRSTQQTGLLPMSDSSGRQYGSRGRDDERLMQRNSQDKGLLPMPDAPGRSYGRRDRDNDDRLNTRDTGLLPMPDDPNRSYGRRDREDDRLNTQDTGLLPMPEDPSRSYGRRDREDNRLNTQEKGLLPMPDDPSWSYGRRDRDDDRLLIGRANQQLENLPMSDAFERSYASRDRGIEDERFNTQDMGLLPIPDAPGRSYGQRDRKDDRLLMGRTQQSETFGRSYGSRDRGIEDERFYTQDTGLLPIPDAPSRSYGQRDREEDRLSMGRSQQSETLRRSYGSRDRGIEDDRLMPTSRHDRIDPESGSSLLGNYSSQDSHDEYRRRMYMYESGSDSHYRY